MFNLHLPLLVSTTRFSYPSNFFALFFLFFFSLPPPSFFSAYYSNGLSRLRFSFYVAPRLLSDKTLSSLSIFPNAYIRKKFLFGIQTEGLHRQQTGHSPSIPSRNRNPEEERIRIRLDTSIDPSFFIVMVRDVSSSRAYRSIYSALFPPAHSIPILHALTNCPVQFTGFHAVFPAVVYGQSSPS